MSDHQKLMEAIRVGAFLFWHTKVTPLRDEIDDDINPHYSERTWWENSIKISEVMRMLSHDYDGDVVSDSDDEY
jgi:hypothetical protein